MPIFNLLSCRLAERMPVSYAKRRATDWALLNTLALSRFALRCRLLSDGPDIDDAAARDLRRYIIALRHFTAFTGRAIFAFSA